MHDVPPNFGKQQGPDSVLAYTTISIKVGNDATKANEFVCDLVYTDLISLMYSRISLFILLSFPKLLKYFQKYINFIHCISECNYKFKCDFVKQICYK